MTQPYFRWPNTQRLATVAAGSSRGRVGTLLLALGLTFGAKAQQATPQFFQTDAEARSAAAASPLSAALFHSQPLTLDVNGLRAALATAPLETRTDAAPLVLALPLPNGSTGRFALREAPIMEPALAAQFPAIKTYAGVGLDDASASVRLDLSPQGFHAQVLTGAGKSFYIDPVTRTDTRHYLAFYKTDMNRAAPAAGPIPSCDFQLTPADKQAAATRLAAAAAGSSATALSSGPQLRTYRLALANTPEYALTKGNTTAGVIAGEVATVNRVVGVYEKELAVRMVLVANNNQLVFLSGTGPQPPTAYTNSDGAAMLTQNQSNINAIIGTANYDIGHVVSTGGGGIAGLGVVCGTRKAQGVTGSPSPVGDAFDIDYVAHEMGHQFAGNHPFNGNAGSCAGGNRNASTAWEPGSGTTIMAYAGICLPSNDLQPHSDPTFHTGNYQEMRAFIDGTTCSTATATGNTAPVVTAPAGGKTLPVGTPFKLTATATDAENDALTYMWEEMDLGAQQAPNDAQVAGQNVPLFRSFVPLTSGTRYFPRLTDLVNNTTVIGERLPTVTRTLSFRCTARDEHSGPAGVIGGVNYSSLVNLNVSSASGPFVVQAPNTAVTWTGGAAQTVTWDVAGTTNAPVSCATVNILLSLDGGLTYPTTLATAVPNNGSAVVIAPTLSANQTQARIMVEAADNYFFDISNTNFTITTPAPGPTITSFTPTGGLAGTVVTVLGSNFTGTTAVAFNGTTAASFTVVSATQLTATVAAGTTTGPITVTAPTGTATSATPFVVGAPPVITSFTPTTGPVGTVVTITGTSFTLASQVKFNNTVAPTFTVVSSTQITATVPAGASTGPIAVTTPVGTGVSTSNFVVIPAPIISSFTPANGVVGTVVVITGLNFTGATQVTFNGTVAPTFTVNSGTQITVTVPAGVTSGFITVTGPGGTGTSTTAFTVPPANDACSGAIALTCGQSVTGTTVGSTATGDPTGSCTAISVDGAGVFYSIVGTGANITVSTCNAATNFDTKLFVYSGTCGSYTCVGANDDAANCSANSLASTVTFSSAFGTTYYVFVSGYRGTGAIAAGNFVLSTTCATPPPTPTLISLTPNAGPIASGVVLTGTNFTGATRVTFNGVATASVAVIDAQTIAVTVPNGATTGNVVVYAGNGIASNGLLFTVTTPVPTISRIAPPSGATGTTVTLTGTGFGGATSVTFNGVAATTFNVTSATSMTAVVPATATTGNVIVTTAGGASNGVLFTVVPPAPTIASMTPSTGAVGTYVTITGTNLTGATSLTLNGVAITNFTVVNGTTITFFVPAGATTGNVVVTTAGGPSTTTNVYTVTTGLATAKANQSEFSVWPNPVAGKATLHVALTAPAAKASATLRNVLGQLVATRAFSGSATELPTTGLATGTYLLTVQAEGNAPSIQRVVVE
ncbi:IPT/TIG domain-containing protein [Microvirga sp. STS02]|uniref:IPT/TIG domain-containing protein n=1 Tax=Hymenobacter negativus TaxID=2795026 RepID=UPI0018DC8F15|nr:MULTISPECIES: IPT/TIG domain-containing protein [Bacteria]MBH8569003.1 IPT/TIG domain-containing protein [Hymenobacter negativus]MBR7208738.1 IPT/TIG domain-containing protein [Microvirga sp. STS02]